MPERGAEKFFNQTISANTLLQRDDIWNLARTLRQSCKMFLAALAALCIPTSIPSLAEWVTATLEF